MNNATMGAAVLSGYLLGRTKKAKLALGLSALLAGSRVRPGQLGKALDAPFLGDLTRRVRTELTDASKAAATSVLTAKADSLAGTLHERTAGLRERAEGGGEEDRAEEKDETEAEAETEDQADEDEAETEDQADEDEEKEQAEAEEKESGAAEGRKSRASKAGTGTSARRSGGRSTPQRSGSTARKSEPRPKKKTAAASRAKSGTGTRSRRQDDG